MLPATAIAELNPCTKGATAHSADERDRAEGRIAAQRAMLVSSMHRPVAAIVTCEHASRSVPAGLGRRLRLGRDLLGHRGWDEGAAAVARELAAATEAPLVLGEISRLVIDLNRSPDNPRRWSTEARALPAETRAALTTTHHEPHWRRVIDLVAAEHAAGRRVLHIGVHSFTPVLSGVVRPMDVALLYDPSRRFEIEIVEPWIAALRREAPTLVVRRNAPYRGVSDGLTTGLRRRFPDRDYAGIELEMNQKWLRKGRFPKTLVRAILVALREVLTRG